MKLYLVLLLAILATAFAGKVRSNKCKDPKSSRRPRVIPITVVDPPVKVWSKISSRANDLQVVTGNAANTAAAAAARVVSMQARNCQFGSVDLDPITEFDINVNPIDTGTAITVTLTGNVNGNARTATNTLTLAANGFNCAQFCYLSSKCTHYNFNDNQKLCTLFSAVTGLTIFSALPNNNARNVCGIKTAFTTPLNDGLFTALAAPNANFQGADNCVFTELPFAFDQNVASESACATNCNNIPNNGCNAYEFFIDQRTCFYKRNSRRDEAVIYSTIGSVRCGAKS